ncbi:hypothetical protein U1Q18_045595, partial [Sarracenia purpurea var. burkii]
ANKSIIEEAWSVHPNLEVTLRDKAVGDNLAKLLRAEKKSLEADFKEFTSCPDSLIPKKLADIKSRIQRIKGISSVILDDRVDSGTEAGSPAVSSVLSIGKVRFRRALYRVSPLRPIWCYLLFLKMR